ncbi:MAG: transcription elongation factor GreA [Planctomycetaceae bacterium]|nr:MAG: transcription elongation factor GreA [Planctomycetaceae bacterium]
MERQPISREGYEKIEQEIRHLEEVELPKVQEAVANARAEGDLRENAEYHGQREQLGMLKARINALKAKLANSYIVDPSSQPKGIVGFGSKVKVKDLKFDEEEEYVFVGPGEEDYNSEVKKILSSSPFAKACMGKRQGDIVEFQAPAGLQRYQILSVEP